MHARARTVIFQFRLNRVNGGAEKGYLSGGILKFMKITRDQNRHVGMPCVDFYPARLSARIKIKIHDAAASKRVRAAVALTYNIPGVFVCASVPLSKNRSARSASTCRLLGVSSYFQTCEIRGQFNAGYQLCVQVRRKW